MPRSMDRRALVRAALALAVAGAAQPWRGARAQSASFTADPFSLGVASGDPRPDGFVLWTRLAPAPLAEGGGLAPVAIPVGVEIAEDEAFTRIVTAQQLVTRPDFAHSAHVEIGGLPAGRPFYYRFHSGGVVSSVGRTQTAPELAAPLERLRFGWTSCAHYQQGYFTAYRDLAEQNPDLILTLGDYIYESAFGPKIRAMPVKEAMTLADYRLMYAAAKLDRDLQAAHAAAPWLCLWDDHELANDYQGDIGKMPAAMDPRDFVKRKAVAYRAYFEHQPLRPSVLAADGSMRLWGEAPYGDLVTFILMDGRQYRSPHACQTPGFYESELIAKADCPAFDDPSRGMLGLAQEAFVNARFLQSSHAWRVLAQQTLFSQLNQKMPDGRPAIFSDGWGGYDPARRRLLDLMAQRPDANIVIGGDMHAFWAADVKADFNRPDSANVATEFVGTSISSHSSAYARFTAMLPDNPHVRFFDDRKRGYVLADVFRDRMEVAFRQADQGVFRPDSWFSDMRRYVVLPGRPGVIEA